MEQIDAVLHSGRERSVFQRHPWIFSGAVDQIEDRLQSGDLARIYSQDQKFLGVGFFSPNSRILFRMLSFGEFSNFEDFFRERFNRLLKQKRKLITNSDAFRIINAESDGLPGLIVDLYGDRAVCAFSIAGMEKRKESIAKIVEESLPGCSVWEKNDARMTRREGLSNHVGRIGGASHEEKVEIREGDCKFLVHLKTGQKTGFYLDQRENRILASQISEGHLLNCCSYTGGFGIHALKGKAEKVTNIEISENVAALAEENFRLNGLGDRLETITGDCFEVLRKLRDENQTFDSIILDPPKFAHRANDLRKAKHAYKDLNRLAFQLLKPGGYLMTFSCSGLIDLFSFRKTVSLALIEAKREGSILKNLGPAIDHSVSPHFPEGEYLKGFLIQVE